LGGKKIEPLETREINCKRKKKENIKKIKKKRIQEAS
jgi:hypothetical protein